MKRRSFLGALLAPLLPAVPAVAAPSIADAVWTPAGLTQAKLCHCTKSNWPHYHYEFGSGWR